MIKLLYMWVGIFFFETKIKIQ